MIYHQFTPEHQRSHFDLGRHLLRVLRYVRDPVGSEYQWLFTALYVTLGR